MNAQPVISPFPFFAVKLSLALLLAALCVCGCRPERKARSEIRAREQVKRIEPTTPRRTLRGVGSNIHFEPEERGIVLARGEGIQITVGDLVDTLGELPLPLRIRYRERAKWEELLKDMVAFEILVRAAKEKGFARDPLVLLAYKKELVKEALHAAADEKVTPGDITDDEIRGAYEDRRDLSEVPKMLHVFVLSTETREKVEEAHQKMMEVAHEPDRVLARLKDLILSHGAGELDIGDVGDAGFVSIDGMGTKQGRKVQMLPEVFAQALFAAGGSGKIAGPMHTNRGFMVGVVVEVRAGYRRSFDEMRLNIGNMLLEERRGEARKTLVADVLGRADISVDRKAFQAAFGGAKSGAGGGEGNMEKPKYRLNIPVGLGPAKITRVPDSRLHELGKERAPKPGEVSP